MLTLNTMVKIIKEHGLNAHIKDDSTIYADGEYLNPMTLKELKTWLGY